MSTGLHLSRRDAHRHVRRELARYAREMAASPGVIGDPTSRARLIEAWAWVADWLAPAEVSVLPANLRALVTPDGAAPEGVAPEEWSRFHGQREPDGDGAA